MTTIGGVVDRLVVEEKVEIVRSIPVYRAGSSIPTHFIREEGTELHETTIMSPDEIDRLLWQQEILR